VFLDKLRKGLEAIEQRETVIIVLLFEYPNDVPEYLLFVERLEYPEVLLADHSHIIFFLSGRIGKETVVFINGDELFKLKTSSKALNGLKIRVVQHLL
jgi:hypothetical protein